MKGNNEIRLNESTMVEVVQQWLNREMPNNTPKVTSVTSDNDNYAPGFTVKVSDQEQRAA